MQALPYELPATQMDEGLPAGKAAEMEGPSAMGWVHCLSLRTAQVLPHPWPIAQVNTQGSAIGVCSGQFSKGSLHSPNPTSKPSGAVRKQVQPCVPGRASLTAFPHMHGSCWAQGKAAQATPSTSDADTARTCPHTQPSHTDTVRRA